MDEFMIMVLMAALGLSKADVEAKFSKESIESGEAKKAFNTALAAKVTTIKDEAKTEGYDKAKGETLTKMEGDIKEKYGIKSNKKGLDLVAEVISANTPDPAKPDSISPDIIKKSKTFLDREKELNDALDVAKNEVKTKVQEVEDKYSRQETNKTVVTMAVDKFKGLKPILSAKPENQAKQLALFEKELMRQGYEFEVREVGGEKSILIKYAEGENKGKRVEDAHGNPLKFEDLIKTTSDNIGFEYQAANTRTGLGGNDKKKEGNQGGNNEGEEKPKYAGKMPTNDAEYTKLVTDKTIPIEHRNEIEAYYNKQQEGDE